MHILIRIAAIASVGLGGSFAVPAAAGAQEGSIRESGDSVTFVNILTPTEGVTLQALAAQLTTAMEMTPAECRASAPPASISAATTATC